MATVRIPEQRRTLEEVAEITTFLQSHGIHFERWLVSPELSEAADPARVLEAFAKPLEALKSRGGYTTADVIDVTADTPNLEVMLAKFRREHWHDEDEVRFAVAGRGLFHIHPADGPVFSIEVEAGDLISVPRGTLHWFDLCADRRILAVRLFQDPSGWTPHYSDSGLEARFQPVCFGGSFLPGQTRPAP